MNNESRRSFLGKLAAGSALAASAPSFLSAAEARAAQPLRRAKKRSADTIGSVLEFGRKKPAVAGRWTLELVLEGDVVDRQMVVIHQKPSGALQPL